MGHYLYLSHSVASKPATVMMRVRDRGRQVKLSTRIQVLPGNWDVSAQRVRESDALARYKNSSLSAWIHEADKALLRMDELGWTIEEARDAILQAFSREVKRKEPDNSLLLYYPDYSHH